MMSLLRLAAFAIVLQVVVGDSAVDKLFRDKKDYIKSVDPGNVTLLFGVSYVCGVYHHRSHTLTSRVFNRMSWNDPRHAWNPKDYSGLTKTVLPSTRIWLPDIRMVNAIENAEVDHTAALVLANGTVIWVPRVTITSLCEDKHGDHHIHYCKLRFGSWMRNGHDMPLEYFEEGFDIKSYMKECPYIVSKYHARIKSKQYPFSPYPYEYLEVDLEIKRRDDDHEEEEDEPEAKKHRWEQHLARGQKSCFWPHC